MKALVVDDSRAMRSIVRRMVTAAGFEVLEAAGGAEALELLASAGPFDALFIDWNMPGLSGLDVVRTARGRPELGSMKIMMITTESESLRIESALLAGADELLMKPFTEEMLTEKLAMLGFDIGAHVHS